MATLRLVSLLAATLSMGLMAGAFAIYAHTIMPGLRKTDDQHFQRAGRGIRPLLERRGRSFRADTLA